MEDEEKKIERVEDKNLEPADPDEPVEDHYVFPLKSFLIVIGVIVTLIIASLSTDFSTSFAMIESKFVVVSFAK